MQVWKKVNQVCNQPSKKSRQVQTSGKKRGKSKMFWLFFSIYLPAFGNIRNLNGGRCWLRQKTGETPVAIERKVGVDQFVITVNSFINSLGKAIFSVAKSGGQHHKNPIQIRMEFGSVHCESGRKPTSHLPHAQRLTGFSLQKKPDKFVITLQPIVPNSYLYCSLHSDLRWIMIFSFQNGY